MIDWVGDATYGGGGKYRYSLVRAFYKWVVDARCVFVMLNPSTATAEVSDPTVRRCEGFARTWGYRMLIILNIFAYRSTNPKHLYTETDPVGPKNDDYIERYASGAGALVCAWGMHGKLADRGRTVLERLRPFNPTYLKLTKNGTPMHPLYLKANLKPKPFFVEAKGSGNVV